MKSTYKIIGYIETYCPHCGSDNTQMLDGDNEYEYRRCYNCGDDYIVEFDYIAVCVNDKHNKTIWNSETERN